MSTIKRYMFEDRAFDPDFDPDDTESFEFLDSDDEDQEGLGEDDDLDEDEVMDIPPAPTFSEEEVAQAQQSAFDEGKAAGRHEAAQEIEQAINSTLTAIAQAIPPAFQNIQNHQNIMAQQAVQVAHAVTKKILPAYVNRHGSEEIISIVMKCLEPLRSEPRLILKVHEDLRDEIFEKVSKIATDFGFDGRVIVMPNSDIEKGDCKIDWSEGGAERTIETLWQEIDAILAQNVAQPSDPSPHE